MEDPLSLLDLSFTVRRLRMYTINSTTAMINMTTIAMIGPNTAAAFGSSSPSDVSGVGLPG